MTSTQEPRSGRSTARAKLALRALCAALPALVAACAAGGVGDPLNTAIYTYRMPVTFSGYTGSTTLTNFPALVVLSTNIAGFNYSQTMPQGQDLRFADAAERELACQIDTWNSAGKSFAWVRIPRLASSTNQVFAYWGDASASVPDYATNGAVWAANYAAVWHMQQPAILDSTIPANHGVANANVNTNALIGVGQHFATAWININSLAPAVTGPPFTFSAFIKTANAGGAVGISIASVSATNKTTARVWWRIGPNTTSYSGEAVVVDGTSAVDIDSNTVVNNDAWHHIAYTLTGTNGTLYVDGVSKGTHTADYALTGNDLWSIGQRYATISGGAGRYFAGQMDEVRVSNVARSADWLKAAADTALNPAGFVTFGAVSVLPKTGSAFYGW